MRKPTEVVSIDLDSTMFDTRPRHHLFKEAQAAGKPVDWRAYALACGDDDIVEETAVLARALATTYPIIFTSARHKDAQQITERMLDKHAVPFDHVFLEAERPGFAMNHAEYKLWRLKGIEAAYGYKVILHIDDWQEVRHLLTENGIPCLCVRTPQEMAETRSEWVV